MRVQLTADFAVFFESSTVINAFSSGLLGAWFRINEVQSAAEVGLCCMHNAPVLALAVHYLLGFLFHKVMQKH